jgi:hypothetical protein
MRHDAIVASLIVLATALSCQAAFAVDYHSGKSNPDWPCQQVLVSHLSPAAMWSGPPINGLNKDSNSQIDDLASKLQQRRLPIDQAKADIDAFAKSAGADRKQKLTLLFASLFDKLDSERSQVIEGLTRFGHRQKEMADKIRAENSKLHEEEDKSVAPDKANDSSSPVSAAAKQLQWDVRIFQDQHNTLGYVCQVPVLIEQRLFGLTRAIQNDLDKS